MGDGTVTRDIDQKTIDGAPDVHEVQLLTVLYKRVSLNHTPGTC